MVLYRIFRKNRKKVVQNGGISRFCTKIAVKMAKFLEIQRFCTNSALRPIWQFYELRRKKKGQL